jgi:hypothetical protein
MSDYDLDDPITRYEVCEAVVTDIGDCHECGAWWPRLCHTHATDLEHILGGRAPVHLISEGR